LGCYGGRKIWKVGRFETIGRILSPVISAFLQLTYRERESEEESWGGVVSDTTVLEGGVIKT
jgi:hypothetical protein